MDKLPRINSIAWRAAKYLTAGAVLSVLIAWACEPSWSEERWMHLAATTIETPMPERFPLTVPPDFALPIIDGCPHEWRCWRDQTAGVRRDVLFGHTERTRAWDLRYSAPERWQLHIEDIQVGFPFHCLRRCSYSRNSDVNTKGPHESDSWTGGFRPWLYGIKWLGYPVIPVRPIPAGLAGNTLFYTGTLWALRSAARSVRRLQRVRTGRCIACGYPASVGPVCPECGAPPRP